CSFLQTSKKPLVARQGRKAFNRPSVVPPSFAARFIAWRPRAGRFPAGKRGYVLSSANGARSVPAYVLVERAFGGQLAGPFSVWRGTGSHLPRLSEPARTRTRPGRRL